jgi:hypothetical protein
VQKLEEKRPEEKLGEKKPEAHFSPILREVGTLILDPTRRRLKHTPKRQWKKNVSLNFWD